MAKKVTSKKTASKKMAPKVQGGYSQQQGMAGNNKGKKSQKKAPTKIGGGY